MIISDASRWSTFVIFSYEKTGWDTAMTTRDSMIGYYTTQYGVPHSEALGVSEKPISFRMASLKGNTGESLIFMSLSNCVSHLGGRSKPSCSITLSSMSIFCHPMLAAISQKSVPDLFCIFHVAYKCIRIPRLYTRNEKLIKSFKTLNIESLPIQKMSLTVSCNFIFGQCFQIQLIIK